METTGKKTTCGHRKTRPTRRTWPLGHEKKLRKQFRGKDDARANAWSSSLFGGNEKLPFGFKVPPKSTEYDHP